MSTAIQQFATVALLAGGFAASAESPSASAQSLAESRPSGTDTGAASRSASWAAIASRPVARFGSHEVSLGELTAAAVVFYPTVYAELDSPYGKVFFDSGALDDWVDAYLDLLALERDPRIKRRMPDAATLERAIEARAATPEPGRLAAYAAASTPSAPREPTKAEIEKARRFLGFDVARQVQLDKLVQPHTVEAELRRLLLRDAWKLNTRLRVRHLLLPIRDELTEKRFPLERRANVKSEADRLMARLRGGEPFATIASQVRGPKELRPRDTLPWLTYDTPLPMPVLRALFAGEKGQYVGPVETRDGIYIGYLEDRETLALPEFGFIRERYITLLRRDEQFDLLTSLRNQVAVVVF